MRTKSVSISNLLHAVIEKQLQLEPASSAHWLRRRWQIIMLVCALVCQVAEGLEAQSLFREPAVPRARTVSSQVIERANIPIVLGQDNSNIVQNVPMESIDSEPESSFIPLPNSFDDRELRAEPSLDDLTNEEFEDRLRVIQGNNIESKQPFIESLADESDFVDDQPGRETIRQRYPNGKLHVLRQVAQDAAGNYYNDGAWRAYSRDGEVLAEGQFERNQMVGQWRRYHNARSGGLFSTAPFNKYDGRFLSVAQFSDGKLNGMWTIYDQNNQKVFEVRYADGKRDGVATWWFPTATKMREATFDDGLLNGKVLEWDDQGKLTRRDEFIRGQRVIRQVSRYRPNRPSEEQFFLDGQLVLKGEDRWWEAKPAAFSSSGQRTQHGPIRRWYENGQPKMQGQYLKDQRVGTFTWWHLNGGRKLEAVYKQGQKSGMWTWWHENGMKSIQGEYDGNEAVGVWTWWDENGKVARQENFDKRNRELDGSLGELTEPKATNQTDDRNNGLDQDTSIMSVPVDRDSNDRETDSQIPLLLDTDGLEEIDPLDSISGELPEVFTADD